MTEHDLLQRQQQLVLRSAQLRAQLGQQGRPFQTPLSVFAQGQAVFHWVRQHPVYPAAAVLTLALLRPRRALVWARRLWVGWRVTKWVQQWVGSQR